MMKILALAGGYDQIELINELKRRGHQVSLADYLENPPAKSYADHYYKVSTLDEEAIYLLAKEKKVDLITTACTDQALLTAARVSEKLDIPFYISAAKALEITNKYYMKKIFRDNDIPTARFVILDDQHIWDKQLDEITTYPLVVKPCDCNSSKGVIKVKTKEELPQAVDNAFQLSRSKKIIVEEFKEGEEISVDIWVDNEGTKILSVSETLKIRDNTENFTIYQSRYPYVRIDDIYDKITDIAQKIVRAFKLSNCPLLIQALVHENEIHVIECSARMGGGTKYKLIEYISGINIMEKYVNRILGDTAQILHPIWSAKSMELNYVYAYNGRITEIKGLDELKRQGVISDFFLYRLPGSEISKRTTSSDRVFGFLIQGEEEERLREVRNYVLDSVDVLDGEKSILYRECYQ